MEPFCRRPPDYVGAHLRFLTHAFTRRHLKIAREMGEEDLSMVHGHLIGFLYRNRERPIYQRDIEDELHITRSSVTSLVKLMEKRGYIARESVESDARLKRLTLTDKGVASFEHSMAAIRQTEELAVQGLTPEQKADFFAICAIMENNLVGKEGDHACAEDHCVPDQGV